MMRLNIKENNKSSSTCTINTIFINCFCHFSHNYFFPSYKEYHIDILIASFIL